MLLPAGSSSIMAGRTPQKCANYTPFLTVYIIIYTNTIFIRIVAAAAINFSLIGVQILIKGGSRMHLYDHHVCAHSRDQS